MIKCWNPSEISLSLDAAFPLHSCGNELKKTSPEQPRAVHPAAALVSAFINMEAVLQAAQRAGSGSYHHLNALVEGLDAEEHALERGRGVLGETEQAQFDAARALHADRVSLTLKEWGIEASSEASDGAPPDAAQQSSSSPARDILESHRRSLNEACAPPSRILELLSRAQGASREGVADARRQRSGIADASGSLLLAAGANELLVQRKAHSALFVSASLVQPSALYARAIASLAADGDPAKALADLRRCEAAYGRDALFWIRMAECCVAQVRWRREMATRDGPESPEEDGPGEGVSSSASPQDDVGLSPETGLEMLERAEQLLREAAGEQASTTGNSDELGPGMDEPSMARNPAQASSLGERTALELSPSAAGPASVCARVKWLAVHDVLQRHIRDCREFLSKLASDDKIDMYERIR